jgi:hypothetical protein
MYWMCWNKKTKGGHVTHDIIWLKQLYYPKLDVTYDVAVPHLEFEDSSKEARENKAGENESSGENIVLGDNSHDSNYSNESTEDTSDDEETEDDKSEEDEKQPRTKLCRVYMKWNLSWAKSTCVGAGIGGGYTNINELRVMKYKEALC